MPFVFRNGTDRRRRANPSPGLARWPTAGAKARVGGRVGPGAMTESNPVAVVHIGKDIVPPLDLLEPFFIELGRVELFVGAVEAQQVLLHALARLSERQKIVLDVLGEGPEMFHWQGIAKTLSLSGITWLGRLPYDAALQIMNRADVLIHTSFREGTPHVVLEALGWGVPVICHDVCGMATAVNDTCGIKVPFVNPERSIQGFCEAIESLLKHPEQVAQLSEGALQRAAELSWDAKVKQMAEAYTEWL